MSNKIEIVLPRMGESVDEATITGWLKNEGDKIDEDDLIVEIATDKVDSEVPSEFSGILFKKLCDVNDIVKVGDPIAIIETDLDVSTIKKIEIPEKRKSIEKLKTIKKSNSEPIDFIEKGDELIDKNISNESSRIYSPLVKNISKQEGVSLNELENIIGSGKNGRVTKNDLLTYISNSNNSTKTSQNTYSNELSDEIIEMSRMEKLISDHMISSKEKSAHVQAFIEADITNLWNWREKNKHIFFERENEKITFTPIFIQIVAQVLREFPMLNISLDDYNIIKKKSINVGMATALSDGNLIVPVIKNADQFSLLGLVKKVNDLAKRSRNGNLEPDEVKDGTYTISNVGVFDTLMGTPIINQPQVGILAFGAINKKPSVIETEKGDFIGIRYKIILSHSFDHRIVNGAKGGLFIKRIKELIEGWDSKISI
ncbi:MAG: 2-oxo acid dehydrogenase subunit E2 [Flavobacteriaceae bacterium]|jgi:2-oxoglutarate dehydrogenase E2 component (dihydrolipoamide succinyltransferase)|nr:2-oxo acid dehydrogenase subunit E2 [Flavobacteriaceae bacterium]MBT4231983.1 2-oxo acid dehydrogenase subunit E2 [Flavobacteriaceae bacterium]MBT5393340.1 2-oxo acid dehydrogenase subunit E2 [Flavobacteriaceae bacterium]MBT7984785.1 2-oxo acid dehydrogenase subunit E2 [Flavobacteriaceae bacterium]